MGKLYALVIHKLHKTGSWLTRYELFLFFLLYGAYAGHMTNYDTAWTDDVAFIEPLLVYLRFVQVAVT
jgi:hypothetical protein